MRFVFAIICFVIAAVMIGAGIAQTTVLRPPSSISAAVTVDSDAPVTIIDGTVFQTFPLQQRLQVSGSPVITVAYGRTTDVEAWVGNATHNEIGYDATSGALTSERVEGDEATVPNPSGSDLWISDFSEVDAFSMRYAVDDDPADPNDDVSFVIASDGTAPAPADISLTWPLDDSTPWAAPLLIGGGVVLLAGLGLLLWAIAHMHRSRGPRRKTPKMPKLPKQPRYRPSKQTKALPTSTRGRRSARTGMVVAPVTLIALLALSGCTNTPVPAAPEPEVVDATATPAPVPDTEAPAVTESQAKRIVQRISEVAAAADGALDDATLATRFAGPALTLRQANYAIRRIDKNQAAVTPIPTDVGLVLPQQNDGWPRTVFVVSNNRADTTAPYVGLMLVQDDPRSQYKAQYAINLEPGAVVNDAAPADVGTNRLAPDTQFLVMAPQNLAAAYGDILMQDVASASYGLFDPEGDSLRVEVGVAAKEEAKKKLPDTAKLTYSNAPGTGEVIVLATLDQGAIVATELNETQTVKPVEDGAAVNAPDAIKALSGKAVSTKGIQAVYGDQLLFYVPNLSTGGQIKLLGYGQGLIAASEL